MRYHARAGFSENRFRPPSDIGEQRGLRGTRADQDIAAVLGGNQNDIRAIAESIGRAAKMDICQSRAVGAHYERESTTCSCCRQHARSQIAIRLRPESNARARDQFEKRSMRAV